MKESIDTRDLFINKDSQILSLIDENAFVISDTHFGHSNVIQFEPSRLIQMEKDGYSNPEDHDKWLIEKWNDTIKDDDIVLHLGDFAFKRIQETQPLLKGRKILILGNHDRKGIQTYNEFEYVVRGLWCEVEGKQWCGDVTHYMNCQTNDELFSVLIKNINGMKMMFSHYPSTPEEIVYSKNPVMSKRIQAHVNIHDMYNIEVNVHGHTHSKCVTRDGCNFVNVSAEMTKFTPRKINTI